MGNKRNLFDELSQSIDDAQQFDAGKITLKTTQAVEQPPLRVDSMTVLDTRESLHLSRGVFARYLQGHWKIGSKEDPDPTLKLLL